MSWGCFSDPQPLPHEEPIKIAVKNVPKFLPPSKSKKGQTGDNWGNSRRDFLPVFSGEKYEDKGKVNQGRTTDSKKHLTPNGFRYSSPAKTMTTPGSNEDAFQREGFEHHQEYDVLAKGKAPEKKETEKKQILVPSGRSGGYGQANLSIAGIEYEYVGSEYDLQKEINIKERKLNSDKVGGRKPFLGNSKPLDSFDSGGVYSAEGAIPAKTAVETGKQVIETKAWIPNSQKPTQFNSFPSHMTEKKEVQKKNDDNKGFWKPNGKGNANHRPSKSITGMSKKDVLNVYRKS